MKEIRLVGIKRWIMISCFVLLGFNVYSQKMKTSAEDLNTLNAWQPGDTTFSQNLRMVPNHDMYPGDEFDVYFDMIGFPPGTMYTALMHVYDVEIAIGVTKNGSPVHCKVPMETIPGKYGIKVVAISGLPPQPKTVLTRDSLPYDPFKWFSVSGNTPGKLIFDQAGRREAILKPVNMARGGYMQVSFHWNQPGSVSANSPVLLQYSTNDGGTWKTAYTYDPSVDYQAFVRSDLPKDAASDHTLIRFFQPNHTAGDGWRMDMVLQTEYGNVVMPNYYENIHFTVIGNSIKITPLSPRKICVGEQLNLPFTTFGNYPAGNVFVLQLSDKDGFFKDSLELGRMNSSTSGTFHVTLPQNLEPGIRYRFRIIAESGGKTNSTSEYTPFVELGPQLHRTIAQTGNTLTAPTGTGYQWYRNDTLLANETNQIIKVTKSGNYSCDVKDATGCAFRASPVPVTVTGTLAIKDAENNYFKLYPNPTNDRVLLETNSPEISGEMEIRIINVYGQTLQKRLANSSDGTNLELNLNAFENGMYYIIILNKDLTIVKPILKK